MRKFLIPEVVQTSALDCGPAALKSLLEGFGIPVSYGRLREACQTDVDGTSIDTMEAVANQLGLDAEQIMLPADHLLLPESRSLPALVVVQLPDGFTHFVIVWRRHGNFLQVMDPSVGRRWVPASRFLSELYRHRMPVPAADWRDFAASPEFSIALRARMKRAGIAKSKVDELCGAALANPGWIGLATLDAAVRLLTALRSAGAVRSGAEAVRVVTGLIQHPASIPAEYWSATATDPEIETGAERVLICGAVLVRALRKGNNGTTELPASAELRAAVEEKPLRPFRELFRYAWQSGPGSMALFAAGLVLSSAGVLVEALLFRSFLDLSTQLHMAGQRAGAAIALLVISASLLLLDLCITGLAVRFARAIETRLRVAFMAKIPKLGDRYFQSRLTSDMASRSHITHHFRHLPELVRQFASGALKLCFTAAALIWLDSSAWGTVLLLTLIALTAPVFGQRFLADRDLRVRSHTGALTRFFLDGMLGLIAIRAHGTERPLRSEYEKLLGSWAHAAMRLQRGALGLEAIQLICTFGLAASLLLGHPLEPGGVGRALLAVYWALNLPVYGQDLYAVARNFPYYRSLTLRLLDPLGAPEESFSASDVEANIKTPPHIRFRDVSVFASGHAILENIDLDVESGAHIAVVGPSGAGKSTLVGLLLGWTKPVGGAIEVDGKLLNCADLRPCTAWVDPAVHVWNRSLFENIRYGSDATTVAVARSIDAAMLRNVLESLPHGLQTELGEGGAFLSGGEGQRVRFARALARPEVQLVILDEPFRGLDREKRRELLTRARKLWAGATLICVTHDVDQTFQFDRIVVVENGRISETGAPRELAANGESRYSALLAAEQAARSQLWSGRGWRRIRVQNGRLIETLQEQSELCEEAEVA